MLLLQTIATTVNYITYILLLSLNQGTDAVIYGGREPGLDVFLLCRGDGQRKRLSL
jgi:hypothetical protein